MVCRHVSAKVSKRTKGFCAFFTIEGFLSGGRPFMCLKGVLMTDGFPTLFMCIWLLSIFLMLTWFVSSVNSDVAIKRGMTHGDFSTLTAVTWIYSRSVLVHNTIWNLAKSFSTLTIIFNFTCMTYSIQEDVHRLHANMPYNKGLGICGFRGCWNQSPAIYWGITVFKKLKLLKALSRVYIHRVYLQNEFFQVSEIK